MTSHSHTSQGITLIESIVSITLLMTAVTGLIALATSGIKSAANSRNELIATHLAVEGLEIIHNIRDNISADDATPQRTGWVTGLFANCDNAAGCVVDVTARNVANVWNTPNAVIECPCATTAVYLNRTTGLYRQTGGVLSPPWSDSRFTRLITLTGIDNAANPLRHVRVISTVTYPGYGGKIQTIRISEDLYNWFPNL